MNTGGDCSFLYGHYHKIEARLCEMAEDDNEEEEDEEGAPPPPEEEEEEEDGVEMVENQYVYDDAAHEMPYVDEYTHLDDEHYFAMEADHDAETAII